MRIEVTKSCNDGHTIYNTFEADRLEVSVRDGFLHVFKVEPREDYPLRTELAVFRDWSSYARADLPEVLNGWVVQDQINEARAKYFEGKNANG